MKDFFHMLREYISDFLLDHSIGVFYAFLAIGMGVILIAINASKSNDINKKVVTVEQSSDKVIVYNPAYEYNSYDVDYTEDYELCRITITYTKIK